MDFRYWLAPLLLLAVGSLLGLIANLAKLAAEAGWPPLGFLLASLLGGGVLLWLLAVAQDARPAGEARHLRYYLISGLLSIALPNALLFSAIPVVGAGFASLCLAFPPLLTWLLALAIGMEHFQRVRMAGIGVGVVGSLLLVGGKLSSSDSPAFWVLATLSIPLFLALGNIYRSRCWPEGASPLSLAPGMLLGGALWLLPLALFGIELRPGWQASGAGWLLLVEALLFTAAYALYFVLQKVAGAVYLSQIGPVNAIVGSSVAVFVLGESGTASMLLAALCVVAGVGLVSAGQDGSGAG